MTRPEDKTILVVDDEPNVREYLATVLRDAGFNVLTANDGEAALDIIREDPPDLISLDLIMPRKSGNRLLYELKRDRKLSRIPVLIVTAHAQDDLGKVDLDDLLENRVLSGPGTYLEKPVNPRAYVRAIMRNLDIEVPREADERLELKDRLQQGIEAADPEALRKALAALESSKKP